MSMLKIIKNDQEHEQALARLMVLMDSNPDESSAEADEMNVLVLLIEKYEEEKFPIDEPDPVEAIKFRMDQLGLSQAGLKQYIGSASKVSEVLSRKRPLSLNMIRKLSDGLGISADVLIKESVQMTANQSEINWSAFPLAEMKKRGYLGDITSSIHELKEYAAEKITPFLTSVPNGMDLKPAMLRTSAHLRSNNKVTDSYALWAWQVRVLQLAQQESVAEYIPGSVDEVLLRKIAQMSWSSQGPSLAKEFLNKHGVHLIYEPHLPKTYLDGAACKTKNGNPIVALTLRHDRLDNYWFTLMHELSHVALHIDKDIDWFLDDLDAVCTDLYETEADELAENTLIPASEWFPDKLTNAEAVKAFANKLNIHPCVVAGRLRHVEAKNHKLFGKLFRDKVEV